MLSEKEQPVSMDASKEQLSRGHGGWQWPHKARERGDTSWWSSDDGTRQGWAPHLVETWTYKHSIHMLGNSSPLGKSKLH